MNFYFTFGTDKRYPYRGGWVLIHAPSLRVAVKIFRAVFPEKTRGLLNCSDYYTEEQFEKTGMLENGNFGEFCHQEIHVNEVI